MNRRNQNVHDLAPSYVNILVGLAFREHTATLQEVGYNSISDAEATIFSPFLCASTFLLVKSLCRAPLPGKLPGQAQSCKYWHRLHQMFGMHEAAIASITHAMMKQRMPLEHIACIQSWTYPVTDLSRPKAASG